MKRSKRTHKKPHVDTHQAAIESEEQHPGREPDSVGDAEVGPPPQPTTERSECRPDQTPLGKWILDGATFVIASLGLCVFWGQWNAAKVANDINATNFRASQRAWIGPQVPLIGEPPIFEKPQPGQPVFWNLHIKNFGNSPAIHVAWHMKATVTTMPISWEKVEYETNHLVVFKNVEFTLFNGEVANNPGQTDVAFDSSQIDLINSRSTLFLLEGRIEYSDVFEKPHISTFCVFYNPPLIDKPVGYIACPILPITT